MKIKPLSVEDEKVRAAMNRSNMQIGNLVINNQEGEYVWIRGFKTPWIWIVEPLDGQAYWNEEFGTKYNKVHFTDLSPIDGKRLYGLIKEYQRNLKRARKIGKLAKIDLSQFEKPQRA